LKVNFNGSWLLALGFWLLALGFWLLALGFWLLALGFWLLVFDQQPTASSVSTKSLHEPF